MAAGVRTLTYQLKSPLLSAYTEVAKAHATRRLSKRLKWRGLSISIETAKGETRSGRDRDGKAWSVTMPADYGYLRGSEAPQGSGALGASGDGEHLDCFVIDGPESDRVFVVHQLSPDGSPDEDKLILNAHSAREAKALYLSAYDRDDLFGAMSEIPAAQLVEHVRGGRANWGHPLVHGVRQKIALHRRQVEKAERAHEERRAWLRGRVAVARSGGEREVDEDRPGRDVEKALGLASQVYGAATAEVFVDVEKSAGVDPADLPRLLRITPSFECVDLQDQITTKAVIREAWPYYELAGNVDLEHLTKKGGKSYQEYVSNVLAQGFPMPEGMDEVAGRTYFEVGRPVKGSFDSESCSFVAEIYKGHPVADWFWSTLTEVSPPWPWKPSIGGAAKLAKVVTANPDPIFGKGRQQEVEVLRMFKWNNTACTLEPVCHYVAPVEVIPGELRAITKGITVETEVPTLKAGAVLKAALMEKAAAVIADLSDSGQVDVDSCLTLNAQVCKALGLIEDGEVSVVKALDYGAVTTDAAQMTGAQAFSRESLSERHKKRLAQELLEDSERGLTPFQKGFAWSDEPVVDVADYLQGDLGLPDEAALAVAESFFALLAARSA